MSTDSKSAQNLHEQCLLDYLGKIPSRSAEGQISTASMGFPAVSTPWPNEVVTISPVANSGGMSNPIGRGRGRGPEQKAKNPTTGIQGAVPPRVSIVLNP